MAQSAFQLCVYADRDISNLRRQQLRKVVANKYKQLCNDTTPLTDNLLGVDLEKQIKTINEMQIVGNVYRNTNPKMNRQIVIKLWPAQSTGMTILKTG